VGSGQNLVMMTQVVFESFFSRFAFSLNVIKLMSKRIFQATDYHEDQLFWQCQYRYYPLRG
jgi:hypothetical protein